MDTREEAEASPPGLERKIRAPSLRIAEVRVLDKLGTSNSRGDVGNLARYGKYIGYAHAVRRAVGYVVV